MKGLIQIAGIIDSPEADLLIKLGADYLGFPLRLPVNKEDLTEDEAAEVIKRIPEPHKAVLITYLDKASDILEFSNKLGVSCVQLHGKITTSELEKLKFLSPGLEVIKSLVIRSDNTDQLFKIVETDSKFIDMYITDTFDPQTGALGATGKTHDWNISKKIIALSPKPVILAGGLNAENVKNAIFEVKPYGVDVHTGVEGKDGRKDPEMVKRFISEAREGFNLIS